MKPAGRTLVGVFCLALAASAAHAGQGSPSPPAEPPRSVEATRPTGTAESYSYNPDGRRDPFLSLVNRGSEAPAPGTRLPGLAGWQIGEVSLRGIIRNLGVLVAILQGPDGKTFLVRPNDKLFDGTVKEVMADAVIFSQDVHDPLSLVKQRDVRKPLRPMEEGK